MGENGVFVFPDAATRGAASSIDPNLLLALQNNGGFGGGNGAWWWIMFMWMMWDRNGRNGNFNEYLASVNGNEGRQYLADIMNGRFDNLNTLAQLLNTSVEGIKTGVFGLQNAITEVSGQIGMSGLQTINAIQSGNTSILSKLCECCCENRLAICQQTNALQSTLAANHADDILQAEKNAAGLQLQLAQLDGADKLAICQQTNTLQNQAERDTNAILNAIAGQNTLITKEFCDLKERELQNKINTQGDIITQLRNQISNDHQTLQFNAAFHALDDKIDAIAAKQPNTVPVQWPNLVGVNATPYIGQGYYPGGNFGGWGSGFGGGIVY
jgi:hypothetical protein